MCFTNKRCAHLSDCPSALSTLAVNISPVSTTYCCWTASILIFESKHMPDTRDVPWFASVETILFSSLPSYPQQLLLANCQPLLPNVASRLMFQFPPGLSPCVIHFTSLAGHWWVQKQCTVSVWNCIFCQFQKTKNKLMLEWAQMVLTCLSVKNHYTRDMYEPVQLNQRWKKCKSMAKVPLFRRHEQHVECEPLKCLRHCVSGYLSTHGFSHVGFVLVTSEAHGNWKFVQSWPSFLSQMSANLSQKMPHASRTNLRKS